jgi:hypothetical protein
MTRLANATAVLLLLGPGVWPTFGQTIPLRVTQRDLVPVCIDGVPVRNGDRSWKVPPGTVTMTLTMRRTERSGRSDTDAGTAMITFSAETRHKYDVEVRADSITFSTRDWQAGAWTPVVRDRTTEQLVSSPPVWTPGPCRVPR